MPSAFEEEDFYRLNEVLSAQAEEDRVQSGADFMASIGITEADGGNGPI